MNYEKGSAVNGNVVHNELTVVTNQRSLNSELHLLQVTFNHRPDGTKQVQASLISNLILYRSPYYLLMCRNKKYLKSPSAEGQL
jgi:hypothetical protein